jgi:hypothetical protein
MRWVAVALVCLQAPGWAQMPEPGDPRGLVDLRWLARPGIGQRIVQDNFTADAVPIDEADKSIVADLRGPGVLDHVICGQVGELALTVDGQEMLRCKPHEAWKRMYVAPTPEERGELPFAFPLVHLAGPYAHVALPIAFRERLVIRASERQDELWLTYRRLEGPPRLAFSTDPGSGYMKALAVVYPSLVQPVDRLVDYEGAEEHEVGCHCPAGERAVLAELTGPAEVVGMRLRVLPGAEELLRYQVIEITADGAASVRMPLVDLVGVSHPWPYAWQPRAGDQVAGIVHPYYRSGGRVEPAIVVYFKLPIPFARSLRIEMWNRSERLPVTYLGKLRVAAMADDPAKVGRLCGMSRRVELAPEGATELLRVEAPGRLVGLSMFTTGHGPDPDWRRLSWAELTVPGGADASGVGLLPLGMQGRSGSNMIAALSWNHNGLAPTGRCGAGRHYWTDPFELTAGSTIKYTPIGKDGPREAELGVLWYQGAGEAPYTAPEVPGEVATLPPIWHGQPQRPLPGGWWEEAEALAAAAEATAGEVRAETVGAKDVFASGDAYLAWNADRPGDALDLLAPMPESQYARLWVHRLLFGAGGTFAIELAAPEEAEARFGYEKTPEGFLDRVLGRANAPASVDCYDVWPHRQAYRFDMPPMLNPAPGRLGRIRFICVTKQLRSRGYLLAIDQLGIDPPPPAPQGWHEMERAMVQATRGEVVAELMACGREDFFGWGGREITAHGPGSVEISLAMGGAPVAAVEVRGIAEGEEWNAVAEDGPAQAIASLEGAKEPSVWRMALGQARDAAGVLRLTLRCESGKGRVLLDAWRAVSEG